MADPLAGLNLDGGKPSGGSNLNIKQLPYKTIGRVILLISGMLSVIFGLFLASRYFGFALPFALNLSDSTLIQITAVVTIISGAFTLIKEIKQGFQKGNSGSLDNLGGLAP